MLTESLDLMELIREEGFTSFLLVLAVSFIFIMWKQQAKERDRTIEKMESIVNSHLGQTSTIMDLHREERKEWYATQERQADKVSEAIEHLAKNINTL